MIWSDAIIDTDAEGVIADPATASAFGGQTLCSDVGYLVRADRKDIVMAVSVCRDLGTYRHANTIPRGWVKEIIYLQRPPKEA